MRPRLLAAWPLLIAAIGCAGESSGSGDLLDSPALQTVVAYQEARDGASLVRLLEDPDAAVRARAAFALGSVQDPRAMVDLIELLADDFASVRAEAAFALGQLFQSSRSVETRLLRMLAEDQDSSVQRSVVEALGKIGGAATADALSTLDTSGSGAAPATLALSRLLARGEASPAALDTVIARLAHPDAAARENAAWGLANAFESGTWRAKRAQVYAALDAYDKSERAAAGVLRALSKLDEPDASRRIVEWLQGSPDWRNRSAAAESLVGDTLPANRIALIAALNDSSPQVRMAVAGALAAMRLRAPELDRITAWVRAHPEDGLTTGALMAPLAAGGRVSTVLDWIRGLAPDDSMLRRRALHAATLLPAEDGVRILAEAAGSPSRALSAEAAQALAIAWAQGASESAALRPVFYDAFTQALLMHDPVTEPLLREVLRDPILIAMGSADAVSAAGPERDAQPPAIPTLDWVLLAELGTRPRLVLETERGRVVLDLFTEEAPLTVQTLARLAREGRFDGVPFHRVLPNFMAQGGDVDRGNGLGEPGFRIPSELTHLRYTRGTAGMARTDKDTENSQFFITHSMQPHLDGAYGAFGRVVEGLDVVDAIIEGDRVTRATIEASPAPTP